MKSIVLSSVITGFLLLNANILPAVGETSPKYPMDSYQPQQKPDVVYVSDFLLDVDPTTAKKKKGLLGNGLVRGILNRGLFKEEEDPAVKAEELVHTLSSSLN